jgi:Cu/Ag efflux protein CusF
MTERHNSMKMNRMQTLIGMGAAAVALQIAGLARADEQPAVKDRSFDGTISAVDATERTLTVKEFLLVKTFHLGKDCALGVGNKKRATLADLKPGMEVEVNYKESGGVLVANRIAQKEMRFAGSIKQIAPKEHKLAVERGRFTKPFEIGGDCQITVGNNKSGTLAELKVGDKITVIYVSENDALVALRIEGSDETFAGTIQAIDASTDTIKAKHLLGDRKFNLADDCKIVIGSAQNGRLSDLRIGQKVAIGYEELDGVLVAHRITLEETGGDAQKSEAAQVARK